MTRSIPEGEKLWEREATSGALGHLGRVGGAKLLLRSRWEHGTHKRAGKASGRRQGAGGHHKSQGRPCDLCKGPVKKFLTLIRRKFWVLS